jgi:pimeloyl-ACP methyl ester carboxylesterase
MTSSGLDIKTISVEYKHRNFELDYFYRQGTKETILMIHGLGGAKEDYYQACKSKALDGYTLIMFDNPGTGNSTYYNDMLLDVDDLFALYTLVIEQLGISDFILCGASMGGLISLLYLQNNANKVKAFVSIEGNLLPEDCMFSSKVVAHAYDSFVSTIYQKMIVDMKATGNTGYHIVANNMQLNTNIQAYYNYSFQLVSYSATGDLYEQFISLEIPKILIYGEENNSLTYLPALNKTNAFVKEIEASNHFVFYDNPKDMFDTIGDFIDQL